MPPVKTVATEEEKKSFSAPVVFAKGTIIFPLAACQTGSHGLLSPLYWKGFLHPNPSLIFPLTGLMTAFIS